MCVCMRRVEGELPERILEYTQAAEPANREAGKHAIKGERRAARASSSKLGSCKLNIPSVHNSARGQGHEAQTRKRTRKSKRK